MFINYKLRNDAGQGKIGKEGNEQTSDDAPAKTNKTYGPAYTTP